MERLPINKQRDLICDQINLEKNFQVMKTIAMTQKQKTVTKTKMMRKKMKTMTKRGGVTWKK